MTASPVPEERALAQRCTPICSPGGRGSANRVPGIPQPSALALFASQYENQLYAPANGSRLLVAVLIEVERQQLGDAQRRVQQQGVLKP